MEDSILEIELVASSKGLWKFHAHFMGHTHEIVCRREERKMVKFSTSIFPVFPGPDHAIVAYVIRACTRHALCSNQYLG
jgi:hypothetical protein